MPLLLIFLSLIVSMSAIAKPSLGKTPSVRALGMGNAYVGVVDDLDSLFYNPAGLAKVRGMQLQLLSAGGAGKNLTDYKDIMDIKDSDDLAADLQPLYGKKYYVGAFGKAGIAIPMFGFAVYDSANLSLAINNPAYTQVDASLLNDYGYALGVGVPIGPFFQIGVEGRRVKRTGTERVFSGGSLASLDTNAITADATNWGVGYALDVGLNIVAPGPFMAFNLGAAWRDVGNTKYVTSTTANIPTDPANLTVGLAARIDLPLLTIRPAFDYTHVTEENFQLWRKFNFGVEIGLPLLDIRAGFSEGYYTWGAGVDLGMLEVDVASYGVELGDYPGQIEDRRYMAQVTLELDIGSFAVTSDGSKKDSAGGSSGSGSSGRRGSGKGAGRSSIWGGPKLKERR